jgi:hypothetical protein
MLYQLIPVITGYRASKQESAASLKGLLRQKSMRQNPVAKVR